MKPRVPLMLDVNGVAAMAGVQPCTIRSWLRRARHPRLRLTPAGRDLAQRFVRVGRSLRIDEAEVREWLATWKGQPARGSQDVEAPELPAEDVALRTIASRLRTRGCTLEAGIIEHLAGLIREKSAAAGLSSLAESMATGLDTAARLSQSERL